MGKLSKAIKQIMPYGLVKKENPDDYFAKRSSIHPCVYNSEGDELAVYYLDDLHSYGSPYGLTYGFTPKTFIWDRFNRSLPIHFYSHESMKKTSSWAEKKFGILRESEQIAHDDYDWIMKNPIAAGEFDAIFTHSARVLDRYSNAKFLPANGLWYGIDSSEKHILNEIQNGKNKNVCMIASNKSMCELHVIRKKLAIDLNKKGTVDVYGNSVGKHIAVKDDVLNEHRYNVAIENDITPYYFTEKILDCFASKTIPIYLGASEIGKWFNTDGIIQLKIEDLDRIDDILEKCNESDYKGRMEAVEDNYARVKKFRCVENYLSEVYGF